jgi:hypothetical protein
MKYGKKSLIYHFLAEDVAPSPIYIVIRRSVNDINVKIIKDSRKKVIKMAPKAAMVLQGFFDHKHGRSQKNLG